MLCKGCGLEKDPSLFYASSRSKCKECVKDRVRKHREDNLERIQEYDRNRPNAEARKKRDIERVKERRSNGDPIIDKTKSNWANRNPEKRTAQYAVSNAIRDGKLFRKTECEHCSLSGKIQAHHWSYMPEHRLDVIWLCTKCHGAEHRRLNDLGRDPDKQ